MNHTLQYLAGICTPSEITSIQSETLLWASLRGVSKVIQLLIKKASFQHHVLLQVFHVSCNSGHYESVLCLLHHALGRLFQESEISTGATFAAGNGQLETLRLLITQPMGSAILQDTLNRSLNIAARNGHAAVGDFLLQKGANPNAAVEEPLALEPPNPRGPIWYMYCRDRSALKHTSLQAALAGYDAVVRGYKSPWRSADISARERTLQSLLEHGAEINKPYDSSRSLLSFVVERCTIKMAESMIKAHAPVLVTHLLGSTDSGPVISNGLAVDEGSIPGLSLTSSLDFPPSSLLEVAARRKTGAIEIINLLMQKGGHLLDSKAEAPSALKATLQIFNNSEIHFTEYRSIHDVLKDGPGASVRMFLEMLLSERISNGQYGFLLQVAIAAQDRSYIELLLTRGIDVNATGHYYGTALQCAAWFGDNDVVQMLLHLGADINVLLGRYGTALRAAVVGGHAEVINTLLENGADVNLRAPIAEFSCLDNDSQSILTLCLEYLDLSIFSSLLTAGAEVNGTFKNQDVLVKASGSDNVALARTFAQPWRRCGCCQRDILWSQSTKRSSRSI